MGKIVKLNFLSAAPISAVAVIVSLALGCATSPAANDNGAANTTAGTPMPPPGTATIPGALSSAGWQVPEPKDKTVVKTAEVEMSTEDGRNFTVTATEYNSKTPYEFLANSLNSGLQPQNPPQKLKLHSMTEYKLNDKIFMYEITARTEESAKNAKAQGDTGDDIDLVEYRIYDRDGDGKFDTVLTGEPKLPRWVLEKQCTDCASNTNANANAANTNKK